MTGVLGSKFALTVWLAGLPLDTTLQQSDAWSCPTEADLQAVKETYEDANRRARREPAKAFSLYTDASLRLGMLPRIAWALGLVEEFLLHDGAALFHFLHAKQLDSMLRADHRSCWQPYLLDSSELEAAEAHILRARSALYRFSVEVGTDGDAVDMCTFQGEFRRVRDGTLDLTIIAERVWDAEQGMSDTERLTYPSCIEIAATTDIAVKPGDYCFQFNRHNESGGFESATKSIVMGEKLIRLAALSWYDRVGVVFAEEGLTVETVKSVKGDGAELEWQPEAAVEQTVCRPRHDLRPVVAFLPRKQEYVFTLQPKGYLTKQRSFMVDENDEVRVTYEKKPRKQILTVALATALSTIAIAAIVVGVVVARQQKVNADTTVSLIWK